MSREDSKEMKKELRKLLNGQTIRTQEGWLIAIPEGNRLIYHGASDNLGRSIICRKERLQISTDMETAFHAILKALQNIGVLVDMQTLPTALCALRRCMLTKAVLLCVLPEEGGSVLIRAYTGRSLLSGIYCRNSIARLKEELQKAQP